jgi:hypothetical protein
MHPLTRNWFLGFAAAGALALTVASVPAFADELSQNLGPVGPNEPILTTVGSKRVIAFYEADGGHCGMHIVVWDRADVSGASAARVRVTLDPRQMVHIDSAENKSLNLQCGDTADTLAIVDTSKFIAAGAAQ